MTMNDWIDNTDNLLKFRKKEVLKNSGNISHQKAIELAKENEKEIMYHSQKKEVSL